MKKKFKNKIRQDQFPDIKQIFAEAEASAKLAHQVSSYFLFGKQKVTEMLIMLSLKDIRALAQAFMDAVEAGEYTTFKGEIILAKEYQGDLKTALLMLLSLYEMDKCLLRSLNCATCTYLNLFKEA